MKVAVALGVALLVGAASASPPASPGQVMPASGAIVVDVAGLRSAQGMVRVSVCPRASFLGDCPWFASAPAAVGHAVRVVVPGVPPGRYAVQAFHDADGDGKIARNWIGLPREGIGFSNDAMPHLTYPRFSVAAFQHGTAPQQVAVTVRYFLG